MNRRNFFKTILATTAIVSAPLLAAEALLAKTHTPFATIYGKQTRALLAEIHRGFPDAHFVIGGRVRENTRTLKSFDDNNILVRMDISEWKEKTAVEYRKDVGKKYIYIYDIIDVRNLW